MHALDSMTPTVEAAAGLDQPALSILMVSYNTRDMTCAAIESISRHTATPFELILVDNASRDGSAEEVRRRFPAVKVIEAGANLGFAKANNVAAKLARADYLLLLNTDTLLLDDAIDRLLSFAEVRPEARIWGGRTLFGDGSLNPTSCSDRMSLRSVFFTTFGLGRLFRHSTFFNPESIAGWSRDSERQVDIVCGAFFLIRRDFWEILGGFDPAFVMYGEETDLCMRAIAKGARPRITPDAAIVHYGGMSSQLSSNRARMKLAARVGLARRHLSPIEGFMTRQLIVLAIYFRYASYRLVSMFSDRTEHLRHWSAVLRSIPDIRNGPISHLDG